MALRVLFAGGGTGGHLFPAIAIADELAGMEPASEITFVGTKNKIESRIVPQSGYRFRTIWISGFGRGLSVKNLLFPFKLIVSMVQTYFILKETRPHVVVGTGGYVSGPVLRCAVFLGIPTLIQEQNSLPGVTTRLLAPKVNEVHLTFEQSKKHFTGSANLFVTGNPTRGSLEDVDRNLALEYFGFKPGDPRRTLLVIGGSLGARSINRAVAEILPGLISGGLRVIWQTGTQADPPEGVPVGSLPEGSVCIKPFIERMDFAYSASDVVVSRAGATTIAELTRLGKPAILIPYPMAAGDHQRENARSLADGGAAILLDDSRLSPGLREELNRILDVEFGSAMSRKSKEFGRPEAAKKIASRIINLAGKYGE